LLAARNAQRGQDEDPGDGLAVGREAGDLRSILAGWDANLASSFESIASDTLLY